MPQQTLSGRAFFCALMILLCVTWLPLFGFHIVNTKLNHQATGTVLVVFPIHTSPDQIFSNVLAADGSMIQAIHWLGNAWIVHSDKIGFVGRLSEQGAWASFSLDLIDLSAIFNCFSSSIQTENTSKV